MERLWVDTIIIGSLSCIAYYLYPYLWLPTDRIHKQSRQQFVLFPEIFLLPTLALFVAVICRLTVAWLISEFVGSIGVEYNFLRLLNHLWNVIQHALHFLIYCDLFGIFVANRALPLPVRRYDQERQKYLEVKALRMSAVFTPYWILDELLDWRLKWRND